MKIRARVSERAMAVISLVGAGASEESWPGTGNTNIEGRRPFGRSKNGFLPLDSSLSVDFVFLKASSFGASRLGRR